MLNHWYIGVRKDVAEHGPCSMVEPPPHVRADFVRREQSLYPGGKPWIAGRRILNFKQLAREAAEIMNRPRRLHRCDVRAGKIPVRRNADDPLRPRNRRPDL